MGLLDELEEYRQPNGLYSNQKNPQNDSTGNGLAITSLALWLANRLGEFRPEASIARVHEFRDEMRACEEDGIPGLFNRSPTKTDQNGWDDYVCILSACAKNALNLPNAAEILEHSRAACGFFNNVQPVDFTLQSFLVRYPQFSAHMRFSNALLPNVFYRFLWCAGIFFSAFSTNPTTIILNLLMIETMDSMSLFCVLTADFWRRKMASQDMKNVVGLWLSESKGMDGTDLPNLDHPIVRYWEVK